HLKPVSNDLQILETARKLFHKEAEILEKLGEYHHIPRLLAYFEEDQEFYLAQEYIEGQTLSEELVLGQQWSESEVIELLQEVLQILVFIHGQSVIHRDVKPDNLIRRASNRKLVLIDFGAIKQIRNPNALEAGSVSVSVTVGTPGYMSTEQGRGSPRPNSDIYSLGTIGIQALTGIHPYQLPEDPNTGELLWREIPVSAGLAAVLTKMVRYHFKDRYETALEALQAVQQLASPHNMPTVQIAKDYIASPSVPIAAVDESKNNNYIRELTLNWLEAGEENKQVIREGQPSKNSGTFRLGRNPGLCDLVLADATVSGLHAEIFFQPQQDSFFIRSLRESNPLIVNGQSLPVGELPLNKGSNFQLGEVNFQITEITLKQLDTLQEEQSLQPPPITPHHTVATTLTPPPKTPVKEDKTIAISSPSPSPSITQIPTTESSRRKLLLWGTTGLGVAGIAVVGSIWGGNLISSNQPSQSISQPQETVALQTEEERNSSPISITPENCRVISPTKGNIARVFDQPSREADTGKTLDEGTEVALVETQKAFIKIEMVDGSQGWVFNDQVKKCKPK
ncbi:MAG: FHA domain-containing serine/threonine-protein kinase, partial [Spirulinaceae cyanobacterium]